VVLVVVLVVVVVVVVGSGGGGGEWGWGGGGGGVGGRGGEGRWGGGGGPAHEWKQLLRFQREEGVPLADAGGIRELALHAAAVAANFSARVHERQCASQTCGRLGRDCSGGEWATAAELSGASPLG